MSDAITRWLQLSLLAKVSSLVGSCLLLLLLVWLLLIRPQQQAQQQLQHKLDALQLEVEQRQHQLARHPALPVLLQQQQHIQNQLATPTADSAALEKLLATRGNQLTRWLPDAEPQQLVLHLSWHEFQPLFSQLNRLTPTPLPARFLLQADNGQLLAQLWLEVTDEE